MKVVATIMGNPHRSALLKETVQGDERGYQPLSDVAKRTIKRQENVELIEMCEHSDKAQCPHCLRCSPTGQICCACGTLLYMEQSDPLRNQFINVTKITVEGDESTQHHYNVRQRAKTW